MNTYERELKEYRKLNNIAKQDGVVLFGSSFAKEIPVCELKQAFGISCDIYNRSINDLSVFDAEAVLDDCINSLAPRKVLIQLGETDLERGYRSVDEIAAAYEKAVLAIRKKNKRCQIVVVSVCDNNDGVHPEELNCRLEALAGRLKCNYADICMALSNESPAIKAFSMLKCYMRDRLTFYDAMTMVNV